MLHGYLLTMNCPKRTITKKWEYEAVKMWNRVSSSTHPRDRTANSSTAFNIGSCACTYTSKNDTQRHLGVHLRCRMRRATVKCNTSSCEPFFSNIQTHIIILPLFVLYSELTKSFSRFHIGVEFGQ